MHIAPHYYTPFNYWRYFYPPREIDLRMSQALYAHNPDLVAAITSRYRAIDQEVRELYAQDDAAFDRDGSYPASIYRRRRRDWFKTRAKLLAQQGIDIMDLPTRSPSQVVGFNARMEKEAGQRRRGLSPNQREADGVSLEAALAHLPKAYPHYPHYPEHLAKALDVELAGSDNGLV